MAKRRRRRPLYAPYPMVMDPRRYLQSLGLLLAGGAGWYYPSPFYFPWRVLPGVKNTPKPGPDVMPGGPAGPALPGPGGINSGGVLPGHNLGMGPVAEEASIELTVITDDGQPSRVDSEHLGNLVFKVKDLNAVRGLSHAAIGEEKFEIESTAKLEDGEGLVFLYPEDGEDDGADT